MSTNSEVAQSLELLLESLIKMVGKSNQNMDHLQSRITQLEWLMKEQHPRVHLLHLSSKPTSHK